MYSNLWFLFRLFYSDVALIKLSSPVQLSEYIQAVPFACQSTAADTDVIALGFGRVSIIDKIFATTLQYTEMKTVDSKECFSKSNGLTSEDNVVCADETLTSICKGDQGGPLVLADSNTLIGVASYANRNCKLGHSHGFIDVTANDIMQWIEEVTEEQICKK